MVASEEGCRVSNVRMHPPFFRSTASDRCLLYADTVVDFVCSSIVDAVDGQLFPVVAKVFHRLAVLTARQQEVLIEPDPVLVRHHSPQFLQEKQSRAAAAEPRSLFCVLFSELLRFGNAHTLRILRDRKPHLAWPDIRSSRLKSYTYFAPLELLGKIVLPLTEPTTHLLNHLHLLLTSNLQVTRKPMRAAVDVERKTRMRQGLSDCTAISQICVVCKEIVSVVHCLFHQTPKVTLDRFRLRQNWARLAPTRRTNNAMRGSFSLAMNSISTRSPMERKRVFRSAVEGSSAGACMKCAIASRSSSSCSACVLVKAVFSSGRRVRLSSS
ncbi:hypothetical protein KC341_g12 [Hortaea werneckii]|nr:hypothetical protein KC341_g12 [Hortaea werneckii]